jgi:multiple sugar transport system substrate-binding protein
MDIPMTRRRVMQRASVAALGTGLAGAALQGCGGGATSPSGTVTLNYGWWSNDPTHDKAMRSWLDDFERAHPKIKVNSELLPWNVYWDKIRTTTAAGTAYDIIGIAGFNAAAVYNNHVVLDLQQFSDYQKVAEGMLPVQLEANNWDGKQYGMPVGVFVPFLGYNRNLLRAANIPDLDPKTPLTFEQLKDLARKLTKRQDGKIVQYGMHPGIASFDTLVYMEGGQLYDHNINPKKVTINTPEGIRGLEDYLSLFKEDLAVPYEQMTNGPWGDGALASLEGGKVALAGMLVAYFNTIKQEAPYIGGAPPFTIKRSVTYGGSNALGIYKGSKHRDEAWEFIKWAVQPQSQMTFARFSDLPANKAALDKLTEYVPAAFAPTLQQSMSVFQPFLVSPNTEVGTAIGDVLVDMVHGKLTPAQAAAQMEQRGNAALAGTS